MYHAAFALMLSAIAPPAQPVVYGPAAAVDAAARDLAAIPERDRIFQRYLWHPGPRGPLEEFDAVLRFQANSLSRLVPLAQPARPAYDLWRVDLRLFDWDPNTWEKFKDIDPYFHVKLIEKDIRPVAIEAPEYTWKRHRDTGQFGLFRDGVEVGTYDPTEKFYRTYNAATGKWGKRTTPPIPPPGAPRKAVNAVKNKLLTAHAPWLPADKIAFLAQQTGSQVPIIRSDFWLANVSRQIDLRNREDTGVGYYDWLRIKDRQDFFNVMKFKLEDSRALRLDQLAAVARSGVARGNRQIERNRALTGPVWFTRDVKDESGAGNAVRNLKREDFKADAQEWYGTLPNGLPFYLLSDDKEGVRQSSAPDFIGPDTTSLSNDGRIHVGFSCTVCHSADVLKPIDDWARSHYTVGRLALLVPAGDAKQFELFERLKRQCLSDLQSNIDGDRLSYQRAIIAACGTDAARLIPMYKRAFYGYAAPVGLEQAAREWGVTPSELRAAIQTWATAKGAVDPQIGGLVVIPEAKIPRVQYEELVPLLGKILFRDLRD